MKPIKNYRIYTDKYKSVRGDFPDEWKVLTFFLEGDVQNILEWCEEILLACKEVEKGIIPHWERNGNEYQLLLSKDGVHIDNLYDEFEDERLDMDFYQFKKIMLEWEQTILSLKQD